MQQSDATQFGSTQVLRAAPLQNEIAPKSFEFRTNVVQDNAKINR